MIRNDTCLLEIYRQDLSDTYISILVLRLPFLLQRIAHKTDQSTEEPETRHHAEIVERIKSSCMNLRRKPLFFVNSSSETYLKQIHIWGLELASKRI